MRILITTIPGFGHFHPIVPLARALITAGHEVAVATAAGFAGEVRRTELEPIAAGLDWDESRLLDTVPELRAVPQEYQGEWLMKTMFLDRSPRAMVPDLVAIANRWRADLIVSGTYEFGGALAAEVAELPYVSCSISFRWNRWVLKRAVGKEIGRLRRAFGLPADPRFEAFGRYLDLCFVPPSWSLTDALLRPALTRLVAKKVAARGVALGQRLVGARALLLQRLLALDHRLAPAHGAVGDTTRFIGQARIRSAAALPDWWHAMPSRPTVHVSLGTVFGSQYPQIFSTILDGLRNEPVNLIMTVGRDVDPVRFGPQPDGVRIERFISPETMGALLPHIDLCINHAGYGTVMDALTHGIPLVLLPLSADQPVIAQTCLINGVAPDLPAELWRISAKGLPIVRPEALTPAMIRDATRLALGDPGYRAAAQSLQAQIRELPGLDCAVALVTGLVTASAASPLSRA